MAKKKVVFVRGGAHVDADRPWTYFHFHPSQDKKLDPVDLVLFDYADGVRRTSTIWDQKRDRTPKGFSEDPLGPQVKVRLSDRQTLGEERPSILGLYEWIKLQPKESIISLQFFTHGGMKAPLFGRNRLRVRVLTRRT